MYREILKRLSKEEVQKFVTDLSLQEIYSLRSESEFGQEGYRSESKAKERLNRYYCEINPFIRELEKTAEGAVSVRRGVFWTYFHRFFSTVKGVELWNRYRRVYEINGDWYNAMQKTEQVDVDIDFTKLNRLPFDSFYIDLTGVELPRTNHYEKVIGILVNQLGTDRVHIVIVDADNSQYNPIKSYTEGRYVDLGIERYIVTEQEYKKRAGYIKQAGGTSYKLKDHFPQSWQKIDMQKVRFVDIMIERGAKKSKVYGWGIKSSNVVEAVDTRSAVFEELLKFTLQFMYFLHSKTEDIQERKASVKSVEKQEKQGRPERREIGVWQVGERYGKRYKSQQRRERLYGEGIEQVSSKSTVGEEKTRKRPRAYIRQAHWHNYWCGKGEQKYLEPYWIAPVYCNGAFEDISTVVNEVRDANISSKGERIIEVYLSKVGVPYQREQVVEIKGHKRRYDFEVQYRGKRMYIEYDGEQHFKAVEQFGGEQGYKERQQADRDKTDYARKQKIPLLRIRYDQISDIPDLIDRFIENPSISHINPAIENKKYYKV